MTYRWCLLVLIVLAVAVLSGCPRGMPPPVFPEVGGGQSATAPASGGPSGGEQAAQPGSAAAPATPGAPAAPAPGGTKASPPGPPAGPGASGARAAQGNGRPMGGPSATTKAGGGTKGGATKGGRSDARGGGFDFMSRLTDDQRKQLEAKVAEMRAKNASPQEIFKAAGDMMKGWGIEVPDMSRGGGNRRWGGGEFGKLTDEQRQQFFAKMRELRQQNASPEKVRAEAEKMLKGFGLDVSKIEWPSARGGAGGGRQGGQGGPGGAPRGGGGGGQGTGF